MKLNRGRKPPSDDGSGMWFFPVTPTTTLRAPTEQQLIQMVFEFRLRNGLPSGDIEREIDEVYCSRWPDACISEPSDTAPGGPRAPHAEKLLDRITRWVTTLARAMPRGGYALADKDTAEKRAAACHGCPNNKSWRGGCAGCTTSVATMLLSLRQMRKTTRDGNLLGCSEIGWDNQTAAHLPKPEITDEQNARLPARCWLKQ